MSQVEATEKELLVVGPGVLGSYLSKLWIDKGGKVTGRTNTTNNHPRLKALGVMPETYQDCGDRRFSNVVFCAPPGGSDDYAASVGDAVKCWDGSGSFVFTSSVGVYPPTGVMTEDAATIEMGMNDRTDRLLKAENSVLEAGGNVVRLAGLFHSRRGPHSFYIAVGTCKRPPNHILHLIHYQDAASLILEVLLRGDKFRSQIFLAVDAHPITTKELVDTALASDLFEGKVRFEQEPYETVSWKQLDNTKTIDLLEGAWSPQYTFERLMKCGGKDWYETSGFW